MAVGLLERLGVPTGRATKVIDGQHPGQLLIGGNAPKPDMLPLSEDDEGRGGQGKRSILVALTGKELDTEVVTIGCNLAKSKKASIFVVYGIEVPRKLAIDAEMPEQTQAAGEALDRAASVAEQMHVHIEPEIIQSRHIGQSLVDEAEAHDAQLLIVGLPYRLGVGGHFALSETTDFVLKNAPCRVWLIRGQRANLGERAEHVERPEGAGAVR